MWSREGIFLRSGGGGLRGGELVAYFASVIGIVNIGYGCGTLVGLAGGEKDVESLGQEYFMYDGI